MPLTPPHITFNEAGVCNVCLDFERNQLMYNSLTDNRPVDGKENLTAQIDKYRAENGKYDCIATVSGGKDSLMTLHLLVRECHLKPLAVCINNGFVSQAMLDNIYNAVDKLQVDLVIHHTPLFKEVFAHFLKQKAPVYYCRICHAIIDDLIHEIASNYRIPLLAGGYTKGQMYLKSRELFWIYRQSDLIFKTEIAKLRHLRYMVDYFPNPAVYFNSKYCKI
jgi:hypothetical protein